MTAPTTGATPKIALDQRASSRHGGFGADSGPTRGDPCRPAIRPFEASKAAVCYVRDTSAPAGRCAQTAAIPDRGSMIAPVGLVDARGPAVIGPQFLCRILSAPRDWVTYLLVHVLPQAGA
jgi:hypothetical protein